MELFKYKKTLVVVTSLIFTVALITVVSATHSWGGFHWARTSNPFTLKLGDNVSAAWDAYLAATSNDWSQSNLLDTAIVGGGTDPRLCRPTSGRVEVCSAKYGFNGWLGVASIWVSGDHITKGTVKVNDSYFNTSKYNKPAWRQFVMCQEVGHTLGLDHQDEIFSNTNLGTCMDYTDDPDGTLKSQPSNLHPNVHDYEQLEAIYAHLDSITTVGQAVAKLGRNWLWGDVLGDALEEGDGRSLRKDGKGRISLFGRDIGQGHKVFTFVFWAD